MANPFPSGMTPSQIAAYNQLIQEYIDILGFIRQAVDSDAASFTVLGLLDKSIDDAKQRLFNGNVAILAQFAGVHLPEGLLPSEIMAGAKQVVGDTSCGNR